MEYKNLKTGIIIDVTSNISGGDWISLKDEKNPVNKPKDVPKQEHQAIAPDTDSKGVTKAQIMQELDAFGVKYDSTAKKDVLYDLMMKGKE